MARKNKEVLVFVADVGPSVLHKGAEFENTTFLEQTVKCIKQVLQRKIFSESKDELALIVYGTENTDNLLSVDGSYKNISVMRQLSPVTWEFVELIEKILQKPARSCRADFVDALVVAFDHIKTKTEDWKPTERQLYFFSPFQDPICTDELDTLIKALVNHGVRFNIIGPKKDETGSTNSSKIPLKTKDVLNRIVEETQGLWFPFEETMESISQILPRIPNPMAWKTNLKIAKLEIPIASYLKVKRNLPKSWKKSYNEDKSARMTNERSHHKYDEAQTQVDSQDIVERYRYGSSLVIYTAEDKANMEYVSGGKCLTVLGFTKQQNIKRHHFLGDGVHYVVADKTHAQYEKVGTAFSAFVWALHELQMVAIVRKVYQARSAPIIGFLMPLIKAEYECLMFIQLPFMEDLRLFTFQSLDTVEKSISKDEMQLMDDLIDAMGPKSRNDKQSILKTKIDDPYIRRLFQCISERNLHPEAPLPEIDPALKSLFSPSQQVVEACLPITAKIKEKFVLEKVEQKKKRTGAAMFQPTLDDNVEAKLLKLETSNDVGEGVMAFTTMKATSVGVVNPVDDFTKIIADNPQELVNASKQMQRIIIQLVTESVGDLLRQEIYNKAIKCLQTLRRELLKEHPALFNDFLIEMKELILTKRKEQLWEMICKEKLGLITKEESPGSKVDKETGELFFTVAESAEGQQQVEDDFEDLVGEM